MSTEAVPEAEPLLVTNPELSREETIRPPDNRRFWLYDEDFLVDDRGLHKPRFTVQEVSKVFFGKGPDWLRWRSRANADPRHPDGYFVLDGKPLEIKRMPAREGRQNEPITARYYTLADIERMAHALAQQGAIDGGQLGNIVLMVKACARIYGIL